jgi:histidyl-tRNA synthetase
MKLKEAMSNQLVQTLKGFRDFLPAEKRKRDFVLKKVIEVFERFGFEPLETPTLEYAELLMGKYGEEADKLVYNFEDNGGRRVGLRYDQTVPTARVLAQYQNDLPRYFRRYQTQNVFRADKPQKGRYREFTQCDIDIFGSSSPLADAEILACTYAAYKNIGFKNITLKINDRQTLMETLGLYAIESVSVFSIIQSIDKLDKVSSDEVRAELIKKGLAAEKAAEALVSIQKAQPSANLQEIMKAAQKLGVPENILQFEPSLARGLDYYTGMIFEISLIDYPVGSCGGGGRYDKLIQQLGGVDIPAVGIAFGFDRTVEAADQLGLIPTNETGSKVLVTIFDEEYKENALVVAQELREAGISTEVYPAIDKLAKQFKLADQKKIPYVVIIGEEEAKQNKVTVKNMQTGEQKSYLLKELTALLN